MDTQVKEIHAKVEREISTIEAIQSEMNKIIVGQREMVEGLLVGLFTGGHILVEGVPGLAKTLAISTLSKVVDLDYKRVQFTPDLLPSDITGTLIYNQKSGDFEPKKGPIFANLILADEINRAPSLNQVGSLNKINKALSKFEQENERMPSSEELSEMIDVPKDKIADTLRVSGRHVSVDAPFVEGEDNSLLDVLVNNDSPSADRGLVNESLNKEIERALSTLATREREIIKSFFGIGCQEMTLEEIGERFGLTRERVRQIKEKAIRKLKNNSRSKLLKSYLG